MTTPNTPTARTAANAASWGVLAWVRRTFFNQQPNLAYNPTTSTQVDDIVTGTLNPLDPDGDRLTFTATNPINGGAVDVDQNGTFTYTPTDEIAAAGGTDTFQVTVSDAGNGFHLHGAGGLFNLLTFGLIGDAGHETTVTVTVDVNAAPVQATPAYTLGTVEHTTGRVPGEFHVTDADADTLSYTVTGGPAAGSVTLTSDGNFTYTPNAEARHEASAEDVDPADLADSFIVTVDDNHGRTVEIPVTVAIDPTNSPPTVTGVAVSDPETDGTVHVSITVTDPDADPITYLVVHDPSYGTVAPTPGGFTYSPSDQARHDAAGTVGVDTDTFEIAASDLHHGVDTVVATVVVSPVNTAPSGLTPSMSMPDPATGVVTGAVTGTDADGDPLTYSGTTTTAKGAVTVNPDGTFAYTPTAEARHNAAADAATETDKIDTFTVTADDAHGGNAGLAVTVVVSPANTAPTAVAVPGTPHPSTGVVTGAVTGTDADGDTLTYTGTTTTAKGAVTVNPDGTFTYTPTPDARHNAAADAATETDKQDTFTVTINDGHGSITEVPVTVAISPTNTAPNISVSVSQPDPYIGKVSGTIVVSDPDGDNINYTTTTAPGKGTATVNPDGSFTYTPTSQARHQASADGAGTDLTQDSFTVTVNDGHGSSTPVAVLVSVSPVNKAPYGSAIPGTPDPTTGVVTGTVSAADPDGDPLTYTGSTTTAKGTVTINPDGTFTYTPTPDARHSAAADGAGIAEKQDSFTVTVNDAHGASPTVNVVVDVGPANQTPTAGPTFGAPDTNSDINGSLGASDADGDQLTYSLTGPPSNGTVIVNPDGTFRYGPYDAARLKAGLTQDIETDVFTVTITDGHGGSTVVSVTGMTVSPAQLGVTDTIPVGTDQRGVTLTEDGSYAYVSNLSSQSISVIDTSTNTVVGTITGSFSNPTGVTLSPDGSRLYAANWGNGWNPSPLTVIDTSSNSVVGVIPVGLNSYSVAVSPDGSRAYVANYGSYGGSSVSVVDTGAGAMIATVPISGHAVGVALNADGSRAYVTNAGTNVAVIDTATNTVIANIPVPGPAGFVTMNTDGTRAYVSGNSMAVIDTATNSVIASIAGREDALGVSADGTVLYVGDSGGNTVSAIDVATNTVIDSVPVANAPTALAVKSNGDIYVVHTGGSAVTVVSTVAGQNTAPVPDAPAYTVDSTSAVTGVVAGTMQVSDPDADRLTYSAPATSDKGGAVSVTPTGAFTYTPTLELRHNASADDAPAEAAQDSFLLTVTDPHGAGVIVPVTVPISPTNTAPTATPSFGTPDPMTGVVTGTLGASDADADPLAYRVTGAPASGTVTVNADGTFAYDPTDAARLRAGDTPGGDTDGFTVAINDGHGGTSTVAVTGVPIGAAELTVTATIPTGNSPYDVAFTADGSRAFVGVGDANEVQVIDTATNTVIDVLPAPSVFVSVNGNGSRVYSRNGDGNAVLVIDSDSDSPTYKSTLASIPVGSAVQGMVLSPDGQLLYVCNYNSASVSVINTDTNTLETTIGVGTSPWDVAITPDGTRAYVVNTDSASVSVINTATNTVMKTIGVPNRSHGVAVGANGARVYVANSNSNTVSVIDTATNTVVKSIGVGAFPSQVSSSPDGSLIYVANMSSNSVSVIDTATDSVIATAPVGVTTWGVTISPDGTVYVSNLGSKTISVLSLTAVP